MAWCAKRRSLRCREWSFFFVVCCIFTDRGIADVWQPRIISEYSRSRGCLQVSIAPPMPGASDYYVGAMNNLKGQGVTFVENTSCVKKSDTEILYEIKGFPSQPADYEVFVRARDKDGQYLTSYITNKTSLSIPPIPSPTVPLHPFLYINATTRSGPSTNDPSEAEGFHLNIWMIVAGGVLAFILIFVGLMIYLRACTDRPTRNLGGQSGSLRSRTSQTSQTTAYSDTLTPTRIHSAETNHFFHHPATPEHYETVFEEDPSPSA